VKVVLDTTYYIPLAGVSLPRDLDTVLPRVRERFSIVLTDVNLLEVAATLAKWVVGGRIGKARGEQVIATLLADPKIERVNMGTAGALHHAMSLRSFHPDFHDCLLLAESLLRADVLLTEDEDLRKLAAKEAVRGLAARVNPAFAVTTPREFFGRR